MKSSSTASCDKKSLNKKIKINYLPPTIKLNIIINENTLCASSAHVKIGTPQSEGIKIESWDITTGWTEKQDKEFEI